MNEAAESNIHFDETKQDLIRYIEKVSGRPFSKAEKEAFVFTYNELYVRQPARGRADDRSLKAMCICAIYSDLLRTLANYKAQCTIKKEAL